MMVNIGLYPKGSTAAGPIALYLLSNNLVLGHDEHDLTPNNEGEDGEKKKDKMIINLLRISGALNIEYEEFGV